MHSSEGQCSQIASKQSHTDISRLLISSIYIQSDAKKTRTKIWSRQVANHCIQFSTHNSVLVFMHSIKGRCYQIASKQPHTTTSTFLST